MDQNTRTKYIETLPHLHKHKSGHIIYVTSFKNGSFHGGYYHYGSSNLFEVDVTDREHFSCIERGEIIDAPDDEAAKFLLEHENNFKRK